MASRSRNVLLFGAAVVVSLALRAPRMVQGVWYDEYCRTDAVLHSGRIRDILLHDVHHPLYNAFMWLWTLIFGDADAVIRVPSLLAGYAALALLCTYLRRRVGAWVAGGVLVWGLWSPALVWYSTEAKNNIVMVFFATLALVACDRLVERPTLARTLAAWGALLGVFATDLVGVLVIVPLLAWMGLQAFRARRAGDRRLARAVLSNVLALLAVGVPWCVFKAEHIDELWRSYLEPFRAREACELLGGSFMSGHAVAPIRPGRLVASIAGMLVAAPLLLLGARDLWRRHETRVLPMLMVGGMLGMAIASAVVDAMYKGREHFIYQPRNLLFVLVPFGAILWTGVSCIRARRARVGVAVALCAVALICSILMQTAQRDRFTLERPRPDWPGVARLLEADAHTLAFVVISRSPIQPLERYAPGATIRTTWGAACGVADLYAAHDPATALYYADDAHWAPITPAERDAWGAAYAVREVGRVGMVTLYRLERAPR